MKVSTIQLETINPFASDYLMNSDKLTSFFPYMWSKPQHIAKRAAYLGERNYRRNDVADHIEQYMLPFGLSEAAKQNLVALRDHALVVIGGQQAGVLTGPLYSIHKVISIVRLAAQQSKQLGIPVVPVFWIAGEDHDYPEVNHIYVKTNEQLVKKVFPYKPRSKEMVSDMMIDPVVASQWIDEVIALMGETDHTNEQREWLQSELSKSSTISEFFARLINHLFKDTGLLLIDAGERSMRQISAFAYQEFAEKSEAITHAVLTQQANIQSAGYPQTLSIHDSAANLFYYNPNEKDRILLERDSAGNFVANDRNICFQSAEILELIKETPANFSTNVVTRPILQEKLFPVLAFVGGPGEIAYWAELTQAFEVVDEEMPPVFPRLSFTIIERNVAILLEELHLSIGEVLKNGCVAEKNSHLDSLFDPTINAYYEQLLEGFEIQHQAWRQQAVISYPFLDKMFDHNQSIVIEHLNLMKQKLSQNHERVHLESVRRYDEVGNSLHPLNGPQDRSLNVLYFLNKYGDDWLKFLLNADFEYNSEHYLLWL